MRRRRPPEPQKEGPGWTGGLENLGYVTIEGSDRPGSKQMEYAADDFEIALVAKGLEHDADYREVSAAFRELEESLEPEHSKTAGCTAL